MHEHAPNRMGSSGDVALWAQPQIGSRCVMLLHTLPAGQWHFDWLVETAIDRPLDGADADARSLLAFRSPTRVDTLAAGEEVSLIPLQPHRRLYLEYEGPISGDRGTVRRVRRGRLIGCDRLAPGELRMRVHWEAAADDRACIQTLRLRTGQSEAIVGCVAQESDAQ